MTKLEAFTQYMSQFASHRGADMQWVMEASSHGRIFSYAWDEATKAEREARPWQGLTDDEKRSMVEWAHPDIIDAIELKLRERNT